MVSTSSGTLVKKCNEVTSVTVLLSEENCEVTSEVNVVDTVNGMDVGPSFVTSDCSLSGKGCPEGTAEGSC